MTERIRPLVAPAYLLLCLLLGGSVQGIWSNLVVQLLAVVILVWAALTRAAGPAAPAARTLWILVALMVALIALQLVPLPPSLWTSLPGRDLVADGFALLGMDRPWLPVSLAPYDTLATARTILPPLAMLAAMLRLGASSDGWLSLALLLGALASLLLGILQFTGGGDWYLYRYVNLGAATGFFANSNHMAALLLASVPFTAAVAAEQWNRTRKASARALIVAVAAGLAVLMGIGIVLSDSAAVLLLAAPVAAASALIVLHLSPQAARRGWVAAAALLLAASAAAIFVVRGSFEPGQATSVASRVAIWSDTAEAIGDHMPVGSGAGTFRALYPQYENADLIDRIYVNHAHNDYLEIALETGLPGIVLTLLFLAWWTRRVIAAWRSPVASAHMKAASIASAALLLHSLVEFPLRTAALATVFAMCLALLALPRRHSPVEQSGDLRPARHLTL